VIDRATADNAFSITTGDHVSVIAAPGDEPELVHSWAVSASGFVREAFIVSATGESVGQPSALPDSAAVRAQVTRDARSWTAQLAIPFVRFGRSPSVGDIWNVNVRRSRALYADDARAAEQREAEAIDWSGAGANVFGSVKLCLQA